MAGVLAFFRFRGQITWLARHFGNIALPNP